MATHPPIPMTPAQEMRWHNAQAELRAVLAAKRTAAGAAVAAKFASRPPAGGLRPAGR